MKTFCYSFPSSGFSANHLRLVHKYGYQQPNPCLLHCHFTKKLAGWTKREMYMSHSQTLFIRPKSKAVK